MCVAILMIQAQVKTSCCNVDLVVTCIQGSTKLGCNPRKRLSSE